MYVRKYLPDGAGGWGIELIRENRVVAVEAVGDRYSARPAGVI